MLQRIGFKINHKTVHKLMVELKIQSREYKKKFRKYDSSAGPRWALKKNRIRRRFKTDRFGQKLFSDVTEFKIPATDEKLYLSVVIDSYNNEIVPFAMSKRPNMKFILKSIAELDKLRTGHQITLHTDQGWQYHNKYWRKTLKRMHIRPSMSKVACCLDNALIESFFNKLKTEIGTLMQYNSFNSLELAIKNWIRYYNKTRIQTKLGNKSPMMYKVSQIIREYSVVL